MSHKTLSTNCRNAGAIPYTRSTNIGAPCIFSCLLLLSLAHDAPHGRRFQAVACGDVDGRCGIAENDANGRRKPVATLGAASSAFAEN